MIIEAVFNVIVKILLGVISLFPAIPKIQTDGMDNVFSLLGLADIFISLKTVSACLVVIFLLKNSNIVWSVIMWVVRKIPNIQ